MEDADGRRRGWPAPRLIWYSAGLAIGIALAVFLMASTIRTILYPIRAVTESAAAIGAGNLDQLVPISSEDELGQLASAFNAMARQLARLPPVAPGTIAAGPANQPGHDQLLSRSGAGGGSAAARRVGQPGRPPPVRRPAPRAGSRRHGCVWQPPPPLRQPLADVLETQRQYLPEGFDKAVVLPVGEETHSFLPRILPIRDSQGATVGAAVLLEDVTRFRLLDEVKSNLVATVSHELKNPVDEHPAGAAPAAWRKRVGPLSPKQLELLVDARDNAERLLVMINNLLDLARLEQGRSQLHLRPERPASLLRGGGRIAFRPGPPTRAIELLLDAARRSAAGGRRCGAVSTCLAEPAGQCLGPHAARRQHHGVRPSRHDGQVAVLGRGHRLGHPRRSVCP